MTNNESGSVRVLGTLQSIDGMGAIRLEEMLKTGIDDVWSALTQSERLARWYGEIDGELRVGGTFSARLHASEWEGTVRVDECESPRRFQVVFNDPDEPHEDTTEVTLSGEDAQTILVVEQRGVPLDHLWAYAAGLQIHVEDLAAYLGGHERGDAKTRFDELGPAYRALAAGVGSG